MVDAVCVDPKSAKKLWPHVKHFIREAMGRGDLGLFGDVEDDVLNGDALLWLAYEKPIIQAAVVTQVTRSGSGKHCTIVACGGSRFGRWIDLIGSIEAYAKSQGCRSVRLMGRKGWQRILKNYQTKKIILERRL